MEKENNYQEQPGPQQENHHQHLSVTSLYEARTPSGTQKQSIFLKGTTRIDRIDVERICYITVDGDCSTFHFDNQRSSHCSESLKKIQKSLPTYFIRIHRNCLINGHKIISIQTQKRKIILINGENLTVSYRKLAILKKRLFPVF